MADTPTTPNPIFYETLAASAKCGKAEAYEHYHLVVSNHIAGRIHPVEAFLEEYAA